MSEEAPDSDSDSSDTLTVSPLVREGSLALGLVVLLLGSCGFPRAPSPMVWSSQGR